MKENKLDLKNVSLLDIFIFGFYFAELGKRILKSLIAYQKTYKNSFSVMYNILKKKYPFEVTLKNGEHKKIENYWDVYLESIKTGYSCKNNQGILYIKNEKYDQEIKLINGMKADINGVFFEEYYNQIPIKNEVIIDVGANIGDSAIYFALNGAKKIISIEPFPKNYDLAKKNIKLNHFSDKIKIIHGGCSSKKGSIVIDSKKEGAWAELTSTVKGDEIELVTLNDLLESNNIQSAVLKMDCEGCEYDVIMESDEHIFEKIKFAIIEYHYGYKDLKKKLEKLGFKVKVTRPRFIYNFQLKKRMAIGYILANK